MLRLSGRNISIMVMYAITLHVVWATVLMMDHNAVRSTAIWTLHQFFGKGLVVVLFSVAMMALISMVTKTPWMVWGLVPQQILLMLSSGGVIEAIWLSQFADGVVRPRAFITVDQIHIVIATIGHTLAIISHARIR